MVAVYITPSLPSSRNPSLQRLLLMVIRLDSVQVAYNPPTEYPDNERDKPIDGLALVSHNTHVLNRDHPSNLVVQPRQPFYMRFLSLDNRNKRAT